MTVAPRPWIRLAALAPFVVALGCASTRPTLPVRAEAFGTSVDTTVDSEVARYYLEDYLAGDRRRPALDAEIDALHRRAEHGLPDHIQLAEVSRAFSPDFAALYFVHAVGRQAANRELRERFQAHFRELGSPSADAPLATAPGVRVLFAPGFLYELHPENGGDFRRQRDTLSSLGVAHSLVCTDEAGSVEDNARTVAAAIEHYARAGERLIIVSASKSGGEVALALGELADPTSLRSVQAWLNIGGVVQGTPLADEATEGLAQVVTRVVVHTLGWDHDAVCEMRTDVGRPRLAGLHIPEHIDVVNYVPVPLSGQITDLAREPYEQLRTHGPSDGLVLLADEVVPGGRTLVELGLDHFLKAPDIDRRSLALLRVLLEPRTAHQAQAALRRGAQPGSQGWTTPSRRPLAPSHPGYESGCPAHGFTSTVTCARPQRS